VSAASSSVGSAALVAMTAGLAAAAGWRARERGLMARRLAALGEITPGAAVHPPGPAAHPSRSAAHPPRSTDGIVARIPGPWVERVALVWSRARGSLTGQRDRDELALARFAEAVARHVRVGVALADAWWAAVDEAPATPLFEPLRTQARRWRPLGEAIGAWRGTTPAADRAIRRLSLVVSVAAVAGAGAADGFDSCASVLRDDASSRSERHSLGAQARASAVLMTVLPPFAAAALAAIDPRVGAVLVDSPLGWTVAAVAAALDAVGWMWLRRLSVGRP
jgi:hypothetical protein